VIDIWNDFILYTLNKLDYGKDKYKNVINKTKYFQISNPFVEDKNPSCCVYKKSGLMRLYNADVNGKNKLEIYEWSKLLGVYNEYVDYLCQYYEMSLNEFMQNDSLVKRYKVKEIEEHEEIDFYTNKLTKLQSLPTTECEEVKLSDFEREKALDYIHSLNLKEYDGLRPCRLRIFAEDYESYRTAIAFDYKNSSYIKYRYLVDSKRNRFRGYGKYDNYYTAQYNNTKDCYVIEGEKEAIIVSKFTDIDVYGLSGTSLPDNKTTLKRYKNITVMLDYDRYWERYKSILCELQETYPNSNVVVRPKVLVCFNDEIDKKFDFGEFYKHGKLNKSIVENGLLSVSDIPDKNLLEKFKLLLDN